MEQTTFAIHFEDRGGIEFERLTFAFVATTQKWDSLEWLGQTGRDGGRDIWGCFNGETYCYQCANYGKLTFKKAKEDIDKLANNKTIPDNFFLVCGGRVTVGIRNRVIAYADSVDIKKATVWSAVEFEELMRNNAPEIIKRFVEGVKFPDSSSELISLATAFNSRDDNDIIELIFECFDRPAFTTNFKSESNLLDFEKAITDTIEVLNTGVHRLRDGTIIKKIPSRHRISNQELKIELALITKLVVKLRDTFMDLKRGGEIKPCGCNRLDCHLSMSSSHACRVMDESRREIFARFKKIKFEFNLALD
jgi:hypothetical protein